MGTRTTYEKRRTKGPGPLFVWRKKISKKAGG